MDLTTINPETAATSAYQAGMNSRAAELYHACAKHAEQTNRIPNLVHFLRWKGNSLMWANRHSEAQTVLLEAASFDGHPQAALDDIYGALTDLCLLSLHTQPYAVFCRLLQNSQEFLEKRGLIRWRHRLDNLQAIACYRRGLYGDGLDFANRAWQGANWVKDGIHYQWNSYLYYMFRTAYGLKDVDEMNRALGLLRQRSERTILAGRLRLNVCEMLALLSGGALDQVGDAVLALARDTLTMQPSEERLREEECESMRVLAAFGQPDEAESHLRQTPEAQPAEITLVQLDIAVSRIAGARRWLPPGYLIVDGADATADASPANGIAIDRSLIGGLLRKAERAAAVADRRMECTINIERVATRRGWLDQFTPEVKQSANCRL